MSKAEFGFYMDSNGKFVNEKAFRESIFQGGIDPSMRKEAWKHLLNVFPSGTWRALESLISIIRG